MANIKLKNASGVETTYNNVSVIKVKDSNGNSVQYTSGEKNIVFLKTENELYQTQELGANVACVRPVDPTRSGYIFRGWSNVSHVYNPANKVAFPYNALSSETLYAMFTESGDYVAEVSGLGSSTVSFIVDDEFKAICDAIANGEFDETDIYGNVFVKIPTLYRKIGAVVDNQITSIALSFTKIDNTYIPYPCFVKPDGTTVMDFVWIGKYRFTSTTQASSVSGSAVGITIGNARSLARALGNGYQLLDWQIVAALRDLSMAYYRAVSNNSVFGINFNSLLIDGLANRSSEWLIAYDPSNYGDAPTSSSTGYSLLSYASPTSNGSVNKLGYDSNNPFANLPNTLGNGYYGSFNYTANGRPLLTSSLSSVSCLIAGWSSNAYNALLCYRPIA